MLYQDLEPSYITYGATAVGVILFGGLMSYYGYKAINHFRKPKQTKESKLEKITRNS